MDSALVSLAVIRSLAGEYSFDRLEPFVPLALAVMVDADINELDPDGVAALCNEFQTRYGLRIPPQPMMSIVQRAKRQGYVVANGVTHKPVVAKIQSLGFDRTRAEQTERWAATQVSFMAFAADMGKTLSERQAERALLSVLKNSDADILMGASDGSIVPALANLQDHEFIASRFVAWAYEADRPAFDFVVSFATGHLLASAVLNWNVDDYVGGLPGLYVYLDAPIILRLAGLTVPARQEATAELLDMLSTMGAVLCVFEHSLQEAASSLDNALEWVESPNYDPIRASHTSRFLADNGWSRVDVEDAIAGLPKVIESAGIVRRTAPSYSALVNRQIDEPALEAMIVEDYRATNPSFQYGRVKPTILLDIKSIGAIHKMRKGRQSTRLEDARCVLVTNNGQLARISRRFEVENEGYGRRSIPCCVTDVFLGTMAWLCSPGQGAGVNVKRIVSDCIAALQPTPALVERMLAEIADMTERTAEPAELLSALRVDPAARSLLVELTQNDIDQFTAQTMHELVRQYEERHEREVLAGFEEERETHAETSTELQGYKRRNERFARVASSVIGIGVFIICTVLFVLAQALGPTQNVARVGVLLLGATGLGSVYFSSRAKGYVYAWVLRALTPTSTR
ncbi:MAG: hypothetical protein U1E29_08225 [Coriobacteriia bacterium]|nr:hypothetical protein [Coriobacteriia bacterium]